MGLTHHFLLGALREDWGEPANARLSTTHCGRSRSLVSPEAISPSTEARPIRSTRLRFHPRGFFDA